MLTLEFPAPTRALLVAECAARAKPRPQGVGFAGRPPSRAAMFGELGAGSDASEVCVSQAAVPDREREQFAADALAAMAAGGRAAEAALAGLYRAYRKPMLRFLVCKGLPVPLAEEALHESFIKMARAARQYNGSGAAEAWIWRIVANTAVDVHRARGPVVDLDAEAQEHLAAELVAPEPQRHQEVDQCVSRALQELARESPERADALRLMYVEGWSAAQVGAFLGRSAGATREFLSQSRRVFKAFLEPCRELLGQSAVEASQ